MSGVCRLCDQKVEGIPILPNSYAADLIWGEGRLRVHWLRAKRGRLCKHTQPPDTYVSCPENGLEAESANLVGVSADSEAGEGAKYAEVAEVDTGRSTWSDGLA